MYCPFKSISIKSYDEDILFMSIAYNKAITAWKVGEIPIGSIIVYKGNVIAESFNLVESTSDPTAHAELIAISQASQRVGNWRLKYCSLYVTKEPCIMCTGAIILSRLNNIIFSIPDPKIGSLGSALYKTDIKIRGGVLSTRCLDLLQTFFRIKRFK